MKKLVETSNQTDAKDTGEVLERGCSRECEVCKVGKLVDNENDGFLQRSALRERSWTSCVRNRGWTQTLRWHDIKIFRVENIVRNVEIMSVVLIHGFTHRYLFARPLCLANGSLDYWIIGSLDPVSSSFFLYSLLPLFELIFSIIRWTKSLNVYRKRSLREFC